MDLTVGAMLSLPFSTEPGTDSGRRNRGEERNNKGRTPVKRDPVGTHHDVSRSAAR